METPIALKLLQLGKTRVFLRLPQLIFRNDDFKTLCVTGETELRFQMGPSDMRFYTFVVQLFGLGIGIDIQERLK